MRLTSTYKNNVFKKDKIIEVAKNLIIIENKYRQTFLWKLNYRDDAMRAVKMRK